MISDVDADIYVDSICIPDNHTCLSRFITLSNLADAAKWKICALVSVTRALGGIDERLILNLKKKKRSANLFDFFVQQTQTANKIYFFQGQKTWNLNSEKFHLFISLFEKFIVDRLRSTFYSHIIADESITNFA